MTSVMLDALRQGLETSAHRAKVETLIGDVGGVVSPVNFGMAEAMMFRARSAALFDMRDRWNGLYTDDAALLEALTRQQVVVSPVAVPIPPMSALPSGAPSSTQADTPSTPLSSPTTDEVAPQVTDDIVFHAERLIEGASQNVVDKTKRQKLSASRFFAKYAGEVHGVTGFRGLRQEHLAGFIHLLQNEAYIHLGKSEHDEGRSIAELRAIWKTKPAGQIGIDKPTADRWVQQLSEIFKAARVADVRFDKELTFDGLVASKARPTRARNKRSM